MKKYEKILDLIKENSKIQWDSAIFCNLKSWENEPENCEIIILEGDDELEDLGDIYNHIPKLALSLNVRQLLDIETLRSVIAAQNKVNPKSGVYDYVHAINHYREYDSFFELDPN
ncbi:hypothetical protein AWM79_21960 [Pseudomonas agarici]|uniref:DUF7716 domain-containing protein n=1 Tax=Pseudomonas agarici TaxID=46677 RepID=A0A0X1T6W9_PSEAA|nr:hypothetical protein [Pseudomonas agarici]AMB87801.1 hypothetical protein AWM79_21960 [Pseudomonas agarici]NWB94072.1 hypothetical protein [Pseudomonas agarici]NWC11793.1 hypothetical protein [Pseudomonas agarici]SEL84546.1 hypothetical protein SAMN05216604_1392 [Pseudomonas agarici]